MPTAIVTGATGMTGYAIVKALAADPSTWTKIFTLSRSQQGQDYKNIVHATLDLQNSAGDMAKQLSGVEADYLFFCAYLARPDEGEAAKVNGAMLQNFLDALSITGAEKKLKRVFLTAGLKQYAVHQGRPKNPMYETDPWLEQPDRPLNFYYVQQRILAKAAEGKSWDWVVTYPEDVIGFAKANFMNLATALGLYAAVSSALPESELPYPGSEAGYMSYNCWTSSKMHAEFCKWASQAKGVGNETFNVINGDTQSWQDMWPKLAKRFGCRIPPNMFEGKSYKDYESSSIELPFRPPIDEHAPAMGMAGRFGPSKIEQRIDLAKWSKRPEVIEAYKKLQKQFGLDEAAWEKATWGFSGFCLGRTYDCVASMTKARKLGWTGYQDTWEAYEETFAELEEAKMLPPRLR
jgi:nucleoside-diphosphate-sugar epimerase